jgi:two-component system CheB/CheR fusion protein
VKNNLATILALLNQTRAEARSIDEFIEVFNGRVQAMAHAHELLAGRGWRGLDLKLAVDKILEPFTIENAIRINSSGPPVFLSSKAALPLSFVLHELSTNAAKYGALSVDGGRVEITWTLDAEGVLELSWTESGGPPVVPPGRAGVGTALIKNLVEYQLGGTASLDYSSSGVKCVLRITQGIGDPAGQSGSAGISA